MDTRGGKATFASRPRRNAGEGAGSVWIVITRPALAGRPVLRRLGEGGWRSSQPPRRLRLGPSNRRRRAGARRAKAGWIASAVALRAMADRSSSRQSGTPRNDKLSQYPPPGLPAHRDDRAATGPASDPWERRLIPYATSLISAHGVEGLRCARIYDALHGSERVTKKSCTGRKPVQL